MRLVSSATLGGLLCLFLVVALTPSASAEEPFSVRIQITKCNAEEGLIQARSLRHTNLRFELRPVKIGDAQLACTDTGAKKLSLVPTPKGKRGNRARGRFYLRFAEKEEPYIASVEFDCRVVLE